MVRVPAGEFLMGSDSGPRSAQPPHLVYLGEFQIAVTEVTVREFRAYVEDSGVVPVVWREEDPSADLDDPVTGILWSEALAFCQWHGLRLPTEAEWEKAARGDDGRIYPWGDRWDSSRANTSVSGQAGVVHVGSFPGGASPFGLLDMSGNAQEWVSDYFAPSYYLHSPTRDPEGPREVLDHGLRGGSWASAPAQSTTFFRDSSHSVLPNDRVGFRCAGTP